MSRSPLAAGVVFPAVQIVMLVLLAMLITVRPWSSDTRRRRRSAGLGVSTAGASLRPSRITQAAPPLTNVEGRSNMSTGSRDPLDIRTSRTHLRRFEFADGFVDAFAPRIDAETRRLAALGWYGNASVDLERRRPARIDLLNPATAMFQASVPGAADWMRLIPTAAALDPIYQPDAASLTSGEPVTPEFRRWLRNSTDARGVRSRAAVFSAVATAAATPAVGAGSAGGRWLSLACGAAQPVIATLQQIRDAGHALPAVTLLDMDASALRLAGEYARQAGLSRQVRVRRDNVLTLGGPSKRATALPRVGSRTSPGPEAGFDLVEAMGFLEYLPDGDWSLRTGSVVTVRRRLAGAVTFLGNAYTCLNPGGLLVVANMLDTHPELGFTLNVIQWPYIRPRPVAGVVALLRRAGIGEDVEVFVPTDGVYAVYVVQKPPC